MDEMISDNELLPALMTKGRTVLYQKDPHKEIEIGNFQPILCLTLTLMWKLVTSVTSKFCQVNRKVIDVIDVWQGYKGLVNC